MELVGYLAASFVAFSGEQSVSGSSAPHEVVFEDHFEMEQSGFEPVTKEIAVLMAPDPSDMAKERLFFPACRVAVAFLGAYSENVALGSMKPDNAERFGKTLSSSLAKRCAGRFEFHPEPRNTFMAMQETIAGFRSDRALNEQSFGKGDGLGDVLNHLSLSPDGQTCYAFVVGSNTQPLGCAAPFLKVLTDITDNIRRCARELRW